MQKRKQKPRAKTTKSRTASTASTPKTSIPWLWLLFGITLGILIYSTLFDTKKTTNISANVNKSKKTATKKSKRNYDFHKLLSKSDNEPSQRTAKTSKKIKNSKQAKTLSLKNSKKIASTHSKNKNYIVQVRSFTKSADAEELKAKLILVGFSAKIKPVKVSNKTWYRVQLGPYKNKTAAKQKQSQLEKNKITGSLLVKK